MMDELLIGAAGLAALGALTSDRITWDDDTGRRFSKEYRDICRRIRTTADSIVEPPESNARILVGEIRQQNDYLRGALDRISRETAEIHARIESVNL